MQKKNKLLPKHLTRPDPEVYKSDNFVTIDFEWDAPDGDPFHQDSTLVLAQWKRRGSERVRVERGGIYALTDLVQAVRESDYIVAHSAQGDLRWLASSGWTLGETLLADTSLAEYVLNGNLPRGQFASLEKCCRRRGLIGKKNLVSRLIKMGVPPSAIPASWLADYGAQDVLATEQLWLRQREELNEKGLLPIFFTRNIFVPVLVDIEGRGMHLDRERVKVVYRKLATRLNELSGQLDELTGGINWNSSHQRAEYVYGELGFKVPINNKGEVCETPRGLAKTDKQTMALLRPQTKEQAQFLELYQEAKHINDQLSKNVTKFWQCCEDNEGGLPLLHFRYNNTATATHRLSSSGKKYKCQGQNLPNDFKPLFTARHPGWLMGESDESQLEYRVAVFLGDDAAGRKDIAEGADVHQLTASVIFEGEYDPSQSSKSEHNKPFRARAKPSTFKPLYGGSSGTERERKYYKAFREKHKGVTAYQAQCQEHVLFEKYMRMPTGLRFYWPDAKPSRNGKLSWPAFSQVCDYPVQCLATADITPIAVTYLWWHMREQELKSFLVNTVHDSAVAELHPDEVEQWKEMAAYHMVETVYWYLREVFGIDFDVPLETETEATTHWSEGPGWKEKWLS